MWGAVLLLLFIALGDSNLMRSESRWAEIVREMLASGDWFNPTINGETYFDKPLLSYWLIALFALAQTPDC
jgi:4-amino-4-deoxy-L-arabinose transferase-like glycosyltransferase